MKLPKQILIMLCLISGLSQAPAANAQAEALVGLGARLIPMVLPMALTAIPMIPVLIKQYAPPIHMPFRGKKEPVVDNNNLNDVMTGHSSSRPHKPDGDASAPEDAPQAELEQAAVPSAPAAPVAPRRQKAADNSDWFMDDENDAQPVAPPTPVARQASAVPQQGARQNFRTTKGVKGVVLEEGSENVPAVAPKAESAGTAESINREKSAKSESSTSESESSNSTIMMKVQE